MPAAKNKVNGEVPPKFATIGSVEPVKTKKAKKAQATVVQETKSEIRVMSDPPKKASSAYIWFNLEQMPKFQQSHPGVGHKELMTMCG